MTDIEIPKLDYEALFQPYTGDGYAFDKTVRWLHKEATQKGIRPELVELAINIVMQEVSNGRVFPKDKCPCGCEIDKSATAFEHEMLARMLSFDKDYQMNIIKAIQERHNASIKDYVTGQKDYKKAEAKKAKKEARVTKNRLKAEAKTRKKKIKETRKKVRKALK